MGAVLSEGASEEEDVDTRPKTEMVINIPEQTSLRNSFTCSRRSGSLTETPQSSSWSLLSLFSLPLISRPGILNCPEPEPSLKSEEEFCTQSPHSSAVSALSLTSISTGSPISLSAISLTFESEVQASAPATSNPDFPETSSEHCALKESTVPFANSSYSYISDDSQSSPSAKAVAPNEPSSAKLPFFEEVTGPVVSLVTKNIISSMESCKTPVAPPINDVIITIDEDDIHKGETHKVTDNVVVDIVSNNDENNMVLVTDHDDGTPGKSPLDN